jgi:hypothetical protein
MCRVITTKDLWNSADPTTRARVRGRAITANLAWALNVTGARHHGVAELRSSVVEDFESPNPDVVREAWGTFIDPAGGWDEPIVVESEARVLDGNR